MERARGYWSVLRDARLAGSSGRGLGKVASLFVSPGEPDCGGREQREDRAKRRERRRMKRGHAPVWPNDLVSVERLVAIAAEVHRGAVRQHFNFDFADQRLARVVIDARRRAQLQEERSPGGEIGMGAFVERTVLVRNAAGNDPPETSEGLQVQI